MAKNKLVFEDVRKLALGLPDVEDSTMYGSPALKVRGQLLVCIPVHKSTEAGSLAVHIDFEQRAELIAAAPDVYYLTDHYLDHPMVLVRLSVIRRDALQDLLTMAWRVASAKQIKRNPPR